MKLLFAAPLSGLPSDPTALGVQASRLHFVKKLFFAAPTSGLPFLPTALLAHVSCAAAEPIANAIARSAFIKGFILSSFLRVCAHLIGAEQERRRDRQTERRRGLEIDDEFELGARR